LTARAATGQDAMNIYASRLAASALMVLACAGSAAAAAQSTLPNSGMVFTCVNAAGRTLTSDRLIGECMDREQRVLSRDGTLIRIVPPSLTADERAEKEARERRITAEKEARAEAVRRDKLLLQRFPSETEHQKARAAALEDSHASMRASEARLAELTRERKPLVEESEFYKGKTLPALLKQQLDANEAATAAQRDGQLQLKAEQERIAKRYDAELAHLRRLWAGAAPGSILTMADADTAASNNGKATKPIKPTATQSR
jgi:hypothetical protein